MNNPSRETSYLKLENPWDIVGCTWPINQFIASNPLAGLEKKHFKEALEISNRFLQQGNWPKEATNSCREMIKWCQIYFDQGQATLAMPFRDQGFYRAVKTLIIYEKNNKADWIKALSLDPNSALEYFLSYLNIPRHERSLFLTGVVALLPGWASYVKYQSEWNANHQRWPISKEDYLAVFLLIICLNWPNACQILDFYKQNSASLDISAIEKNEISYKKSLVNLLARNAKDHPRPNKKAAAQFVFCIDTRSEVFRRALEQQGNYQTYGFAGFFGLPIQITEFPEKETYAACPVLLKPKHEVKENIKNLNNFLRKTSVDIKNIYQGLKYQFTTPLFLVELLGPWLAIWMLAKTFFPKFSHKLKQRLSGKTKATYYHYERNQDTLEGIEFEAQAAYAENFLKSINLIDHFSDRIFICGHESETENNAYASSLNCGACASHSGGANARIMAAILNTPKVRDALKDRGISLPHSTQFIAAVHNTCHNDLIIFHHDPIPDIKFHLQEAKKLSNYYRANAAVLSNKSRAKTLSWSQTRPEWGLANNAAFIIGPRRLTQGLPLDGRCFLHSYNWEADQTEEILSSILTAPVIVAQWINSQYLFSSLDIVNYGSGSKITQNVACKLGVMQGNASDLMSGLPLQSVYSSDIKTYHKAQRLQVVVYSPRDRLKNIIIREKILNNLVTNSWVFFICMDPNDHEFYELNSQFEWKKYEG